MSWSARQYSLFEQQRTRPVRDLVAAIPRESAQTAVDLGCGPGNSTEVLAERFPQARVTGLDSSTDMLGEARQRLAAVEFIQAEIGDWKPAQTYDVILANASLQWVPDHAQLYPRLVSLLNPGGVLAVQTPDNLDEPAHRLAREIAAGPQWADRISDVRHPDRHPAPYYFDLLRPHCAEVDVWRTTYHHPLAGGHPAVVEWFKGSALRPYLQRLDQAAQQDFLDTYLHAISQAYPLLADGTVLLPFPRLFIVATR
ncbi:trans-aconitate 2-methyltransferase [Pseudomonas lutea]|jgi:trans-aconitate 2-methyltransferase|uniref:Trans-aconitate 2-methyltransferase n=1 Tax=Pseudomonas lutea TaxID=243924 RepID=A0ABR9A5J9_9PSED|nr:trans-aconitate 2-methyltransferase [Pseudomonas lutea]MBD8120813.1 trans-aconitate 2-methyltransferase [Pseudomonas lutea]